MLDTALGYMHPAPAKAPTGCPECDATLPHSHAHSDRIFMVTSRSRLGHLHTVWLGGVHAGCTCEHGVVQKARKQGARCYHVGIAAELRYRGRIQKKLLPSSDYDLFDGDEIEPPTLESLFRG